MRISRGTPEARSRLCVCQASFLMTFAMGGVPHAGPQQEATGFLHPVEPQAPLPSEYDADYTNCIADPAHSTNCLTVALCSQFTEPMVGKAGAKRLEENVRSYRNHRCSYSFLAGAAAIAADPLYSLLSWLNPTGTAMKQQ